MIKVTSRQRAYSDTGSCTEEISVIEHKDGIHASVYNGVLTIFNGLGKSEINNSIAGYMPDAWIRWELV